MEVGQENLENGRPVGEEETAGISSERKLNRQRELNGGKRMIVEEEDRGRRGR